MIRTAETFWSKSSERRHRRFRILLFLISAFVLITLISLFSKDKPLPRDLSNGRYPATFQTVNRRLQKYLIRLDEAGYFKPFPAESVPGTILRCMAVQNTMRPEDYSRTVLEELKKTAVPVRFGTPLENPYPGEFGRCLQRMFQTACANGQGKLAAEYLTCQFMLASLMLRSNQADLYYLESALNSAKEYQKKFGAAPALQKILAYAQKLPWPFRGLVEYDQLTAMRDFEKIRLNGIRLFDGKLPAGTLMKESVLTFSFSGMAESVSTAFTDFFYDVDQDQIMTLGIYQQVLSGTMPSKVEHPARKMSIRCIRRLLALEGRYKALMQKLRH